MVGQKTHFKLIFLGLIALTSSVVFADRNIYDRISEKLDQQHAGVSRSNRADVETEDSEEYEPPRRRPASHKQRPVVEAESEEPDTETPESLGNPPVLDTNDPNFLAYTANKANFDINVGPSGGINISEGNPRNTCIIILNIGDAAMSYFRTTFQMAGASFQNASNVEEAIQAIYNCQDAMGGPGTPIENLVFATHGLPGFTQLGLTTSGKETRKLIDALTGKNFTLANQPVQGREVPIGKVRFLSCLVAKGVDTENQSHLMTELSAGLMGIKGRGAPNVKAWNQVMFSGPGHISSHGNEVSVTAKTPDDSLLAESPTNDEEEDADDEILAESPVKSPTPASRRALFSSLFEAKPRRGLDIY